MALNPFFLQGSPGEQFLLQDLINEQLKIYGIDVYYIPRKIVGSNKIIREASLSKLNDNFIIEAYLNNYEGYGRNTDIMSKFGIQLNNEITLTISKERFDTFISPFLAEMEEVAPSEILVSDRPREGDVIYFPLGKRLYEIKHVEFENPFYQLGKNYIYEIRCELLELEDEIIETSIDEIDGAVENYGYVTQLIIAGFGVTATATATLSGLGTGSVRAVDVTNDGYNYTSTPIVTISAPEHPSGVTATAVAITTSKAGAYSIEEILLTNSGSGYSFPPTITISGGGGSGAAATAILGDGSIATVGIASEGSGYVSAPIVTADGSPQVGSGATAEVISRIGTGGTVTQYLIRNAGFGYTIAPNVTVAGPPVIGVGTFITNEVIVGSLSSTTARVKKFDLNDRYLDVYINSGNFTPGETITGSESGASYTVSSYDASADYKIPYADNEDIEEEADLIIDFSQSNPFGEF